MEDFQFDEHIFQMGWFNHQPENPSKEILPLPRLKKVKVGTNELDLELIRGPGKKPVKHPKKKKNGWLECWGDSLLGDLVVGC